MAEILAELLFTGFAKEESYSTMAAYSCFSARMMGMPACGGLSIKSAGVTFSGDFSRLAGRPRPN